MTVETTVFLIKLSSPYSHQRICRETAPSYSKLDDYQPYRDGDPARNLIRLEIYNKRLETTRIEQVPAVSFEQAVGNAGGLFGLWLGASMLTILEVCEFMVHTTLHFFRWMGSLFPKMIRIVA